MIQATATSTKPSRAYSVVLTGFKKRPVRLSSSIRPIVTPKLSAALISLYPRLTSSAGAISTATMRSVLHTRRKIIR